MRTADVTRSDDFSWKVSCRSDSELFHALYVWDCDFSDSFEAFSAALSRADAWINFGIAASAG